MAKYRFICNKCNTEDTRYAPSSVSSLPCSKCDGTMDRQMPNVDTPVQVNEVIDPLTNKKWQQNQEEMLKERRDQHYWEVEVPRLVKTHSIETCLEQGWLVYNDKGELEIGKAPNKR